MSGAQAKTKDLGACKLILLGLSFTLVQNGVNILTLCFEKETPTHLPTPPPPRDSTNAEWTAHRWCEPGGAAGSGVEVVGTGAEVQGGPSAGCEDVLAKR